MLRRTVSAAAVSCLAATFCIAQVPREDRFRITDPDRLEALGFPRDATNVFDARPAPAPDTADASTGPSEAPQTWGGATGYTTIPGLALEMESGLSAHLDRFGEYTHCVNSLASWVNYPTYAYVPIEVPEGAKLGFLRYWAYDSSPDLDLIFRVYETCQAAPTGSPVNTTLLGEGFTIASIGNFNSFSTLNNHPVNNRDCYYYIQVEWATADAECQPAALLVRKFQVSWTRQVSPAPATATFADVPTSHPFFRFVEALVDSGITAGCGNGNYCPNNPISRGEMAVFLAAALGLSWP